MRDKLAGLAHDQWSGWMKYMFSKCQRNLNGTLTIPKWAVDRWGRQLNTKFEDLSEEERESDRNEADKFLKIIEATYEEVAS